MPHESPKIEVVPLPSSQVSFRVLGQERLRWNFAKSDPRPCFYPLLGPSGQPLTRIGHPGAPNHDHHRSVWFAHQHVTGINFWSDMKDSRIVQQAWLVYDDGEVGVMAVRLAWHDGHDPAPLLTQEVIALVRDAGAGETWLELQTRLTPTAQQLELGKTNFGLLAVRVARSLSVHFGGGTLTNREGLLGEPAIFGKRSGWMDYSGPVRQAVGDAEATVEGITFFDHHENPRYPTSWHVREDGWMGASLTMHEPLLVTQQKPLELRYLLHAHAGPLDPDRARSVEEVFFDWPHYEIVASSAPHRQFELRERES